MSNGNGPQTPEDAVEQAAIGPKRVSIGGETVENQPLKDQMEAAAFVAAQQAAKKPHFGLRFTKLVPPGTG